MSTPKRILFVDDEPGVREALLKLSRGFADQWEAKFAASGHEALDVLHGGHFDAVVTDLVMPGMPGAELLEEVARQHPTVIRIVLAPIADQPRVMECAALTHQFIIRPCDADELFTSIDRACDMEAAVRHERASGLVERMDRLPSLPDLYLRLVDKMADPECTVSDVAEVVGQDIGMTARILKVANSAYFGLRCRVASPQEAVNFMGMDTVKALVLSINAFAQFENVALGGVTLEGLWNHSLMTAGFAKTIAREGGLDGRKIDEAFVAGMLHDTGKLALAANFPNEYTQVVEAVVRGECNLLRSEESVLGASHPEVGGKLLGLWGLPDPIVRAVSWHHDPMGCKDASMDALACVHAANIWSHAGEPGSSSEIQPAFYERIGVSSQLDGWRAACLENDNVAV